MKILILTVCFFIACSNKIDVTKCASCNAQPEIMVNGKRVKYDSALVHQIEMLTDLTTLKSQRQMLILQIVNHDSLPLKKKIKR